MVVLTFSVNLFDLCQFLSASGAYNLNEGLLICSKTLDRRSMLLITLKLLIVHLIHTSPAFYDFSNYS